MAKNNFCFTILLVLIPFLLQAEEVERKTESWIGDFFQKGIQSVFAEYTLKIPAPQKTSAHYYKRASYSVEFDNTAKVYTLRFVYDYREDWNILTDNGNHPPVQEPVYFVGSKIQPWTNSNGLGSYSEIYQRTIPNWFIFEKLDSVMIMQGRLGNPLPSLTGIFHSDELKTMKKLYKEDISRGKMRELLTCFEFDRSGNLLEFSKSYLDEFKEENLKIKKPVEDYSIVIRNNTDDVAFIKPLLHTSEYQIIEGIGIKSGDKKARIFSFELNALLHRFVPHIMANPQDLLEKYLLELQKESEKKFLRFQPTEEK